MHLMLDIVSYVIFVAGCRLHARSRYTVQKGMSLDMLRVQYRMLLSMCPYRNSIKEHHRSKPILLLVFHKLNRPDVPEHLIYCTQIHIPLKRIKTHNVQTLQDHS